MKLDRLEMRAFGPFAFTEEVNFKELDKSPVFLINGPTGAGKTTILDAISFALFAELSGKDKSDIREREAKDMRSHHADPDVLTCVSLEFHVDDKRYKVERVPQQSYTKHTSKGSVEKSYKAEATLYEMNEQGVFEPKTSKIQEVNSLIEEILGLSGDEFRQIVVLPQGKFRKLLVSKSEEKQRIMQTLFHTKMFSDIEKALKEEYSLIKLKLNDYEKNIGNIFEECGVESIEELLARANEVLEKTYAIDEDIKKEKALYENMQGEKKDADDAARLRAEKDASCEDLFLIESKNEKIEIYRDKLNKHNKADKLNSFLNDVIRVRKEYDSCLSNITKYEEEAKILKDAFSKSCLWRDSLNTQEMTDTRDNLASRIIELAGYESAFDEIDKHSVLEKELYDLDSLLQNTKNAIEDGVAKKKALEDLISKGNEAMSSLALYMVDEKKLEENINIFVKIDELEKENIKHYKAKENDMVIEANLKFEVKRLKEQVEKYQSIRLAKELRSGAPCPVCGSCDHPSPASTAHEKGSDAYINYAKAIKELSDREENLVKTSGRIVASQTKIDGNNDTIESFREKLGEENRSVSDLKEILEETKESLVKINDANKLSKDSQKELSDLQVNLDEIQRKKEHLEGEKNLLEKNLIELSVSVERIKKNLPEDVKSKQELHELITLLKKRKDDMLKELDDATGSCSDLDTKIKINESNLIIANRQKEILKSDKEKYESLLELNMANDGFISVDDLTASLMDATKKDEVEETVTEYDKKLLLAAERAKKAIAACENLKEYDMESIEEKLKVLTDSHDKMLAEKGRFELRLEQLNKANAKYDELCKDQVAIEKHRSIMEKISNTANGINGPRLTFERYVLGTILDRVTRTASMRLLDMTDRRYTILRTQEKERENAQSGLELMIHDSHTGRERHIATLSGGESFLAALAMSLGLAEVVESYSGAIRLETIFIDEGFGSLDSDALDAAMRAIMKINESGRHVGIISHVPELKERISSRIDVVQIDRGSKITIKR